jgi:hypothetical protein
MASTTFADIKIGDTLILATNSRYRGDETVTVSRIGRAYIYVARDGQEIRDRFHRDTGIEDSNYGGKQRLYTPAQYDDVTQCEALYVRLRDAGIEVAYKVRGDLTADQLRAILTIVQPDDDRKET